MDKVKRLFDRSRSREARRPYRYRALPDHNTFIRLFRMLPQQGSPAQICGSLTEVPIEKTPPYKAISYMCGTDPPRHEVVIDGKTMMIRKNLFELLSHQPFTSNEWLWVDALCISQDDLVEKSSQVGLMGKIYQRADSVLVWLGLPAQDSVSALEFLNFAEANYGDDSVRQMLAAEFEGDIGRLTMAVEELFQRPYWNRLWPVQEIVLARQISLQCGSVKIGWDSFLFWSYNTNAIRSATGDNSVSGKYWPIRRYEVDHLVQQRADAVTGAVSEGYNARHDLLALVQTHARKHCEDPRDRVYAMLSMANPVPSGLSVKLIEPDYEKSSEDLLFDLLTHARPDGRTGWLFLDSWLKSFKPAWLWASGLPSLDSLCHTIWNVPQAYRIKAYPVGKISKCWKAITVYGQGTSKRCHGFSIQTPLRYKNGRPETSRFTGLNGGEARPGDMAYNLQDLGGAGFIVRRIPGDAGLPQRSNVCGLEELFEFIGSTHCVNRLGTYDYVTPIDEATAVPDSLARDVVDLLRYNEFALKQHGAGDYPVLEMEIDRRTLTRILYMAKQATGFESSAQWKDLNWVALQSYWPRPEGADDKDNEP